MHAFRALMLVLGLVLLFPITMTYVPVLEAWLFPVVEIQTKKIDRRQDTLLFDVYGEKFRGCPLERMIFSWRMGHIFTPASITRATGETFIAESGVAAGQQFEVGPLTAKIPPEALAYGDASLVGTLYYRCHMFYNLEYSVTIPVFVGVPDGQE